MATERWIGGSGQGLTFGACFSTEINSLAQGSAYLSAVSINNATTLDIFADISFQSGAAMTAANATGFLGFYLYPVGANSTTYGDGAFASGGAGPPPGQYWIGNIGFTGVSSGTTIVYGVLPRVILPPGQFAFVLWNQTGGTLPTNNVCDYRTYNRSIA